MWFNHKREGEHEFSPFISIFVSLVLILLFRRIDKRIINFNKFKKYAEKLSSDFNIFFSQKKEDISESIQDLDNALKKAAQVLAKIEMTDVSLKSNYGEIQNKRDELNEIKGELSELTNIKKDISSEINNIEKNLPFLKKLSKRIQKMGVDIVRNEKAVKNTSSMLPGIEKKAREETERVLSEAGRRVLDQAKELFAPIIKEYSESLEFLKSSHGTVAGKFQKELQDSTDLVDRRLEELNGSIAVCQGKITSFESETVGSLKDKITELDSAVVEVNRKIEKAERESIRTFLKKAEDEYKNYATLLEKTQSAYKGNMFMKIEERAKDLSSYIARLEGRVQNLLDDVKVETDKYGEVLNLKIKSHEGEADILKNRIIDGINEEANKSLLKIKPIASEMNEKLLAYKEEFSSILGQVKTEYTSRKETMDNEIISFKEGIEQHKVNIINQIDTRVRETARKLTEVNNRLEQGIREATDDVGKAFREQLKEYEESITSLDGSIGDLQIIANTGQEMIEKRIESVFRNYQPDIEDKIKRLKRATEESFSAEREKLVQRIDDIISGTTVELDNREQEIKGFLSTIEVTINSSGDELKRNEGLIKENVEMFKIEARQELLRELENLKAIFKDEKENVIAGHSEELKVLERNIDGVKSSVEGVQRAVDSKLNDAFGMIDSNIKEIEANYVKTEDDAAEKIKARLEGVNGEIDRIRGMVESFKDEALEEITGSLEGFKEEMEGEIRRHREAVGELEAREGEIKEFLDTVKGTVFETEERLREREEVFKGELEEVKGDARQELMKEIEGLKGIFEEEKEKAVGGYEQELKGIKYKIDGIDEKVEDIHGVIERKVSDALEAVEGDIKEIEVSYLKTEGDVAEKVKTRLEGINGEVGRIRGMVESFKDEALEEITGSLEGFKEEMGGEIRRHREAVGELEAREGEIKEFLDTVKGTVFETEERLREREEVFKGELEEVKGDARQELMKEIEGLKGIFEEEKEKAVGGYEQELRGLEERIGETNGKLEDIHGVIERKVSDALEAVEGDIKEIEVSYLRTEGDVAEKVKTRLEGINGEVGRIRGMVESFKDEALEEITGSLEGFKEEMGGEIRRHREAVGELEARGGEIKEFLDMVKGTVFETEERLREREEVFKGELEEVKGDARQELMKEIEGLKGIFEEEKEKAVGGYEQELRGLEERIGETNGKLEDIHGVIERKVSDALEAVEGDIKEIEVSYLRTEGDVAEKVKTRLEGINGEVGRIRGMVESFKDEALEEITGSLEGFKEEMGGEIRRHREAVGELEAREGEIKEFLDTVKGTVFETEERLREREEVFKGELEEVKGDARQELMKEIEGLKGIFEEEKEKAVGGYEQELRGLEERIGETNGKLEDIHGVIERKVSDALEAVEGDIKEIEVSYLRTEGDVAEKVKTRLEGINGEVGRIRGMVESFKDEALEEITGSLEGFKEEMSGSLGKFKLDMDEEFGKHKSNIKHREDEILMLTDEITGKTKSELKRSYSEASDTIKRFEEGAGKVQKKIEKGVSEIEKRITDFEKGSSIIKRAVKFKEEIEADTKALSELILQLKEDKKDVVSLNRLIQDIKKEEGDISSKIRQIKGEKKLINDIANTAGQAISMISAVDEKIKFIESEKDVLDKIESDVSRVKGQYKELEDSMEKLKSKEVDIDISIETITKTKDFISNLEKRTELLKESFTEIKGIKEDLKNKIAIVDGKTSALTGNEKKVDEVLSRFKEMDSLVIDIEARTKQLQSTREWLARTESRLANLSQDAVRIAGELKQLTGKHTGVNSGMTDGKSTGKKPAALSVEAESKVKTVLTLYDQQWSIQEICKVTKMSRGEVELILELNNRG